MIIDIGSEFTIKSLEGIDLNGCKAEVGDSAILLDVVINDSKFPFRVGFGRDNDYFSLEDVQIMAGIKPRKEI